MLRHVLRFARRGGNGRAALLGLVTAGFTTMGFLVLSATSLSPTQVQHKEFGRFDQAAGYGAILLLPGESAPIGDLEERLSALGLQDYLVTLTAPDIPVASLPDGEARLQESLWETNPFPERYVSLQGRWPRTAGEVVLTESAAKDLGRSLDVAGGAAELVVVGVAEDRYSDHPALLAGPGTWADLPKSLGDEFAALSAQPFVLWRGGSSDEVRSAIAAAARAHHPGRGRDATEARILSSYSTTRAATVRNQEWLDRVPAAYAIPSLVLPFLTVGLVFGLLQRRLRRLRSTAHSIGLDGWKLPTALCLSTSIWILASVPVGVVAGWAIVKALRPLLESAFDRPVDLDVSLWQPTLRLLLVSATACLLAVVIEIFHRERRDRVTTVAGSGARAASGARRLTSTQARRLLALVATCAAFVRAPMATSPADAMMVAACLSVGILLLVPDLLRQALRLLPEGQWATRLARRRIAGNATQASALVALVAATLGSALGFLGLLDTMLATADSQRRPEVAEGHVLVVDRASKLFRPAPRTTTLVSNTLTEAPIQLAWTLAIAPNGDLLEDANLKGTITSLVAVAGIEEAERILSRDLTVDEAETLDGGGVLTWVGGELRMRAGSTTDHPLLRAQGRRSVEVAIVPVTAVEPAYAGWQFTSSGLVLRSTAEELALPLTEGALLFTGVTEAQSDQLRETVLQAGLDPETVLTHEALPPLVAPAVLTVVAAGLTAVVFLLATLATWFDARSADRLRWLLTALGISPAGSRRVVLSQHALLILLGGVLGIAVAAPAVFVPRVLLAGYQVSIPWGQSLVLVSAALLACFVASLTAVLRTRAFASSTL